SGAGRPTGPRTSPWSRTCAGRTPRSRSMTGRPRCTVRSGPTWLHGPIRADLAARGQSIGPNDLMIAAIALANGLTLVTHNTMESSRVPRLAIEDWQVP